MEKYYINENCYNYLKSGKDSYYVFNEERKNYLERFGARLVEVDFEIEMDEYDLAKAIK